MAVTVSIPTSRQQTLGTWNFGVADVTMDSSYPTGGESIDPSDFGIDTTVYICLVDSPSGYVGVWDYTNSKLKVYTQGITTGSTAAADSTSGALVEDTAAAETAFRAMGTAIDTTYDMGPLKEVPSATDLSSVKFRVLMIGV